MSERKMKNTTLSVKTGISKNTISSISQNDVKMIQLETINKICQALQVDPSMFFSYLPFDLEFIFDFNELKIEQHFLEPFTLENITIDKIDVDLVIKCISSSNSEYTFYNFHMKSDNSYTIEAFPFSDMPHISVYFEADDEENRKSFADLWKSIPIPFQIDLSDLLEKSFQKSLSLEIDNYLKNNDLYRSKSMVTTCLNDFQEQLNKILLVSLENFSIPSA